MAYVSIEERRAKCQMPVFSSSQIQVDLTQSEQVEVVDQECAEQHDQQAGSIEAVNDGSTGSVDAPNDAPNRLPQPEHLNQRNAGKEDVRASFDGLGHEAGPRPFEPWTGHDAVLYRKGREQRAVNQQCPSHRASRTGVDGFRHTKIAQKTNRVQECSKEHRVARAAECKRGNSSDHWLSPSNSLSVSRSEKR